jgi:hypothetical protein
MKDEESIDWKEKFPQLPLDKKKKLKERSWKAWEFFFFCIMCFFLGKRRRMSCEKTTSCYV